jgi:UPF0042 nucleotide-binding protein
VLLISGLAGAGRTTALRALEDLGYEAVDNLPLELLPHLVSGIASAGSEGPIAIGIDSRSRGFSAAELLARIESLRADLRFELVLVFLDCTDDVLIRRFTETRRRHPLAPDRNAADGIAQERTLMFPIRAVSDLVLDTSNRSMAELKRLMTERFGLDRQPGHRRAARGRPGVRRAVPQHPALCRRAAAAGRRIGGGRALHRARPGAHRVPRVARRLDRAPAAEL